MRSPGLSNAILIVSCPQQEVRWLPAIASVATVGAPPATYSIATVCLWISCYLVSQTFPWMLEEFKGALTFWFYAAICGVALVFVALVVPETKGKTLEEIERGWKR